MINKFKQDGLSIILVSSEMPEVLGMSDRILVMREGRISGEFSCENVTQEKLLAVTIGEKCGVNFNILGEQKTRQMPSFLYLFA